MLKIEEIWPELEVEEAIGQGSYGIVYRCVNRNGNVDDYCAVKVISVPQNDIYHGDGSIFGMTVEETRVYYKEIVEDFGKEIQILESLKGSKNIVGIQDSKIVEKEDGIGWQIFIKMDLMIDFETYISRNKLTEKDIIKLGCDLCDALSVCASKNIIHRDIKPENIFIDQDGNFRLGDFGVAKQLEKTEASMSRKGTYNYMAPEVLSAKHYDSRADIYSLALVMYKLLNDNRMPFIEKTGQIVGYKEREAAFARRTGGEPIPPISGCSDALNAAILRACEFEPDDRFSTVEEFKDSLVFADSASSGSASGKQRKVKKKKKSKKSDKKNRKKAILISVISVVATLFVCFGTILFISSFFDANGIEYSGMRRGVFTDGTADYCVGVNSDGYGNGNDCRFVKITKDKIKYLSDDKCTLDFVIVSDKIYYTAFYEKSSEDGKQLGTEYKCCVMDTKGKHNTLMFSYGDYPGKVVYAEFESVYYLNKINDSDKIGLFVYDTETKKHKLLSEEDKSVNEIIYYSGYIMFSYCSADGKDGGESELWQLSTPDNTLTQITVAPMIYDKSVKRIFARELTGVYIHSTEVVDGKRVNKIYKYEPYDKMVGEILTVDDNTSIVRIVDNNIYLRKLVGEGENSHFEYYTYNYEGKLLQETFAYKCDVAKTCVRNADNKILDSFMTYSNSSRYIYAEYDNKNASQVKKTSLNICDVEGDKVVSYKVGFDVDGAYYPVGIGEYCAVFAPEDSSTENAAYLYVKKSDLKEEIGKYKDEFADKNTFIESVSSTSKSTAITAETTTKFQEIIPEYTAGKYQVLGTTLNIRTGPGADYGLKSFSQFADETQKEILAKNNGEEADWLVPGCTCDVTNVQEGWGETISGWISLKYCKKIV